MIGEQKRLIDVIIPAYNEEDSIAKVISEIPEHLVNEIVVANNGSTDLTAQKAVNAGATVVDVPVAGYGNACFGAMEYIANKSISPDIIVFLDGDYSDYPAEMAGLIEPILLNDFDMVIGSRALGNLEKGAMQPHQIFGNWLATNLIKLFYNYSFTDLGPFRAIKYDKLLKIDMQDRDYGWTVEMQVKAAKLKMKSVEVPVNYRKRIGVSKVSGTIKGSFYAGHKIIWTIFINLIK